MRLRPLRFILTLAGFFALVLTPIVAGVSQSQSPSRYADDIPLLAYTAGEEYRLEVVVTEVYYDDGSIWEAKKLPGKLDLSKMR